MELLIGGIVDRAVRTRPHAVAATLGRSSVTFVELDERASRTAHALLGLGAEPGDTLVWLTGASLRSLDALVACARLGLLFAPVNPALSAAELTGVLDYLHPRWLVTDADQPRPGRVRGLRAAGRAAVVDAPTGTAPGPDLDALTDAAAGGIVAPGRRPVDTDPHIVYLTSGSTARPKGVLVSHRASWLRAAPGGGTFATGLRGSGGVVCSFPLYHYGGWHYVLEAWQSSRAVHLIPRASAEHIVSAVETWRASALYCIPAVWERVLDGGRGDLRSLEHADTGTSGVSPDLVDRIKSRLPTTTTTILYGSTEAGRMAALQDRDLGARPGSVGLPAFPLALWIADDEVRVSGETVMNGYLDLPEATAAAFDGTTYRSGDLGRLDEDGYLYLVGRSREVIRTGGEDVSPAEVEAVLARLPGVRDVAVVGLPDPAWGELVCAVLVMADGVELPAVDVVRRHAATELAPFKVPRIVRPAASIPRTPATGQVRRTDVRRTLLEETAAEAVR